MTNKNSETKYLSCSTHAILNHRSIDVLLHDHIDGQVTHPLGWGRAVMPIGIKNSRGETNHWCLVLIENEYSMLTLFEPIENMRLRRNREMQQLCSDMEFYTKKPWKYTVARTQPQKDGYNCGVHVCAIGAALLQEKCLNDISPPKYRRKIRNVIQRHFNGNSNIMSLEEGADHNTSSNKKCVHRSLGPDNTHTSKTSGIRMESSGENTSRERSGPADSPPSPNCSSSTANTSGKR